METNHLTNKEILLIVIEPWDFSDNISEEGLKAKILSIKENVEKQNILIKLANPIKYKNTICEFFVGSIRWQDASFERLANGEQIDCNFILTNKDKVNSSNPFDISWWRGGISLIASISIVGLSISETQ